MRFTTFLEDTAVSSTWCTCGSGLDVVTVHPTRAVKEVMCPMWTSLGIPGKTVNGVSKIISFYFNKNIRPWLITRQQVLKTDVGILSFPVVVSERPHLMIYQVDWAWSAMGVDCS